jgi:NAD(P)H-hydrate epimerase
MGFNGGDGFAAARHLHGWGYPVRLVLTGRIAELRDEPAVFARILQRAGCSPIEVADDAGWPPVEAALRECGAIIDALLGIGARGAVREPMASLIERMNRSGKPIVAVDLPSGLDGDTGRVQGIAVRARATVALGLAKQGCVLGEGPAHTGSLSVDPITFPSDLLESSRT